MEDLNPKARALVKAGQGALRASEADRARIEAALRAQLGPEVLPPGTGAAHVAGSLGWRGVAGLALGAAVVLGAALFVARPGVVPPPTEAPRPLAPVALPAAAAPVTAPAQAEDEAEITDPPAVVEPTSKKPRSSAAQGQDRLAEEVALLSRATTELRGGHAAQALKALDEHQRRFPGGALSEDRRAAKAQALCLLGRVAQGRAELASLPAQSPVAARAAQVCDAGSLGSQSP